MYQTLAARFGEEALFKDVDDVPLGSNFRHVLAAAIEHADIVVVLMGPNWLGPPGEPFTLLERDGDVVRIEIEAALTLGVPLLPILVRGARMPSADELPDSLGVLSDINAAYVEHRSWLRDLRPVITAIEHQLDSRGSARRREAIARLARARDAVGRRDWAAAEDALSLLGDSDGVDSTEVEALAAEIEHGRESQARRRRIEALAADADREIGARSWPAAEARLAELRQEGADPALVADIRRRIIGGQEAERRSASAARTDAAAEPTEPAPSLRTDTATALSVQGLPEAGGRASTLEARISSLAADMQERRQARPGRGGPWRASIPPEPPPSARRGSSVRGGRRRVRIASLAALAAFVVFLVLAYGDFFDFGADNGADRAAESPPGVAETLDVGESPGTPAVADGKIWVPSFSPSGDLTVVDPISNDVITTVEVADGATSRHQLTPAVTEGLLWVPLWGNLTTVDGRVGVVDTLANAVVGMVDVGGLPETPAVVDDTIWVPRAEFGQVAVIAVIDVADQEVVTRILAGGRVESLFGLLGRTPAVAHGKVWIPDQEAETLVVVDAATNRTVATVTVGPGPTTPAVANDKIWVPNTGGRTLTVIDAATSTTIGEVGVGAGPTTPAVGDDKIWVANHDSDTVTVIDAATNGVLATVSVGSGPVTPVVAEGKIWVPNSGDDTVTVIDAATNETVATVTVGPAPGTPAVAEGKVWVPNTGASTLSVIDARTSEVIPRVDRQDEG